MRAMVTGVADGIGGATCRLLARRACQAGLPLKLAITATGTKASPQALLDDLAVLGAEVTVLTGDLSNANVARDLAESAVASIGGMDLVVSNAGRVAPGRLTDLAVEIWDAQFNLNVRATLVLAQALYPALRASRGAVVAVASMSGVMAHSRRGAYAPAKAALISLVRNLAQEWAPTGVRVNAVSPGMIETPATRSAYADKAFRAEREGRVPLGRIGRPEDVAEAIVYLGSPAAAYVTGQNLLVDGGVCDSVLDRIPDITRGAR